MNQPLIVNFILMLILAGAAVLVPLGIRLVRGLVRRLREAARRQEADSPYAVRLPPAEGESATARRSSMVAAGRRSPRVGDMEFPRALRRQPPSARQTNQAVVRRTVSDVQPQSYGRPEITGVPEQREPATGGARIEGDASGEARVGVSGGGARLPLNAAVDRVRGLTPLRQAVVWAEILGPPRALRPHE